MTFSPLSPEPDDVRLVNESSRCAGAVRMYYRGEWRSVGEGGYVWNMKEAAVVCRQLGCGSAVSASLRAPYGDESEGSIMSNCRGSESALRECDINLYRQRVDDVATVICSGIQSLHQL